MDHVLWSSRPDLRTPVLITAFTGWNDAGDAASMAVQHLVEAWSAELVATIDGEEFFDFQSTRPNVRLIDGMTRAIEWPSTELYAARTPGGDVLLLLGTEPQLKWRTFCRAITETATEYQTSMVVTLGALLADVPHARPVSLIGTATDQELIDRFGLQRSRYEGPTGINGVLHDACGQAGLASASLWAAVPAYAPGTPSPKAALALVRRTAGIVGTPVITAELEQGATEYEREVDGVVAGDEDLAGYVRRLEAMADGEDDDEDDEDATEEVLDEGGTDRLVEEVERFLRDQGPD
jgi:predicted ATP-grasp superfamily ATP-dependent carboligase